jgi:signal transduction histidine kinase
MATRSADLAREGVAPAAGWVVAAVLVSAAVGGAVIAFLDLPMAFDAPALDIAVGTLVTLTGAALAVLFLVRHRRSGSRSDAVLAVAFAASAPLEAKLAISPDLEWASATAAVWGRSAGRLLVTAGLVLAAWLPDRPERRPISSWALVAVSVAVFATALAFVLAFETRLPTAAHGSSGGDGPAVPHDLTRLAWWLLPGALLAVAAVGFARQARGRADPLLGWLAIATAVLAASRLFNFLFPTLRADWVTVAEGLRAVAQIVLLVGIVAVFAGYWKRRVIEAAIEERRQVARELHDGLAQELAYLSTQTMLATRKGPSEERLRNLADSAERALQEARMAIVELSDDELSLDHLVRELAREASARHGRRIEVVAEPLQVPERMGRDLARIAGEAMANAVRHGRADRIDVRLHRVNGSIHLSITDDGRGFDPDDLAEAGFGLSSMTARAERLGGECSVVSAADRGTSVIVEVPDG